MTKRATRQATGGQIPTESELGVITVETEAVISSHPLVGLSEDSIMGLEPVDILSPRISLRVRLSNEEEDESIWLPGNASTTDKLLERWRETVNTLDKL